MTTSFNLPGYPEDMVEAVARDAEAMAVAVAAYLESRGVLPDRNQRAKAPVELPAEFLLELGAALRLAEWEKAGLRGTLRGLPAAQSALADVLRRAAEQPEEFGTSVAIMPPLLMTVITMAINGLSWHGRAELNADVAIAVDDDDEADVLEILANLIWDHRHLGAVEE
jgi:hypothetical protein